MLGAILGGASFRIVLPTLARAELAPKIVGALGFESAVTDLLSVVVTGACIDVLASELPGKESAWIELARSTGIGLGIGLVAGLAGVLSLRPLGTSRYTHPLFLGVLCALYALVEEIGGSGPLGVLAAAVVLGNAAPLARRIGLGDVSGIDKSLASMHDEITFFVKAAFFTLLGAMVGPPFHLLAAGAALAGAILVVRGPAVLVATAGKTWSWPARSLAWIAVPRGMAAGALALVAGAASLPATDGLVTVALGAILATVIVFAAGFPLLRRVAVARDASVSGVHAVSAADPTIRAPSRDS
jgi:NhaP-type Na+/H+ or K+/H+ antiporter